MSLGKINNIPLLCQEILEMKKIVFLGFHCVLVDEGQIRTSEFN